MNGPGAEARAARDEGIGRAAQHADEVVQNWGDRAYSMLLDYLTKPEQFTSAFTSEDVREHAERLRLPEPPHLRAWGSVFVRASRAGLICKAGVTEARAKHVHCGIIAVWRKA